MDMKKTELRNLLFEEFEKRSKLTIERCKAIIKKRDALYKEFEQRVKQLQAELDQEIQKLREAYGDVLVDAAMNSFGSPDLRLVPVEKAVETVKPGEVKPTKSRQARQRKGPKRKKKRGTIKKTIEQHLPKVIEALKSSGSEFTAREFYQRLVKVIRDSASREKVSPVYVSLFLTNNSEKLGLESEKRKAKGISGSVKFFRFKEPANRVLPGKRVDWKGGIISALKLAKRPLSASEIKKELRKLGVSDRQFKGGGFYTAISRELKKGVLIKLKDGRYRIGKVN